MFDRLFLFKTIVVLTLLPSITSCYFLKSTSAPIPFQSFINDQKQNDHLIIFLPGLGDEPSAFSNAGFFDSDTFDQKPYDYLLVDSHLGYYTSRQLSTRIKNDILDLKSTRYKKVTLVGTSLGGLGAILLADEHSEVVQQVVLIAPYMGNQKAIQYIQEAGGLVEWYQQGANLPEDLEDREQSLIAWEGSYRLIYQHKTKVILSYGEQDGFAVAGIELAKNLPKQRVFTQQGGHKWKIWKKLWKQVIQSNQLTPSASN